jgi:hypothetical protein
VRLQPPWAISGECGDSREAEYRARLRVRFVVLQNAVCRDSSHILLLQQLDVQIKSRLPNDEPKPAPNLGKTGERLPFTRIPYCTITRGPEAGKNFPISKQVASFNARFNYISTVTPMPEVEKDWPRLL